MLYCIIVKKCDRLLVNFDPKVMVPINEVLIAKIVLGYLSSRNLSSTAESFIKECEGFRSSESEKCGKERILNHLEGLNLLPSLEDILNDYFAYQRPDEVANDKIYMLWKQLDIVIGQLRAITLGKTKSKAFMSSRRAQKTYSKLIDKNEDFTNEGNLNRCFDNQTLDFNREIVKLNNIQKVPYKEAEKNKLIETSEQNMATKLITPVPVSPKKHVLNEDTKKAFKSPRRKRRQPRRNVNGEVVHLTEEKTSYLNNIEFTTQTGIPMKEEFSELVAALISNDILSVKLADNINKVVSVEPKPLIKENEDLVDEVIKLTADDPDLNILFSMIGGCNHAENTYRSDLPVSDQFCINSEIGSAGLDVETCNTSSYPELHSTATISTNTAEILDSNIQPIYTELVSAQASTPNQMDNDTNLQNLFQPNFASLLNMIGPYNNNINQQYSCIRDLNDELCDLTNNVPHPVEALDLPKQSIQENTIQDYSAEEIFPATTKIFDKNLGPIPKEISINDKVNSPKQQQQQKPVGNKFESILQSEQIIDGPADCGPQKASIDDSEILASHALLQLSTSPLKLSSLNIENVVSKTPISPQEVVSNGKVSRQPICSTNFNSLGNTTGVLGQKEVLDKSPTDVDQNNQSTLYSSGCNQSGEMCVTQPVILSYANDIFTDIINSKGNKKQTRKKRVNIKISSAETLEDDISLSRVEIEEMSHKKSKRSKDVIVTQLDFDPPNKPINFDPPNKPINRSNQCKYKGNEYSMNPIFVESGDSLLAMSTLSSLKLSTSVAVNISPKIVVTDKCEAGSPACLLHAKFNSLNSKNMTQIESKNVVGSTPGVSVTTGYSIVKPCLDQFQTFRIKGNAISKVCSTINTSSSNCTNYDSIYKSKSKTVSMVINNTDSLSKITTDTLNAADPSNNRTARDSKNICISASNSEILDTPASNYGNVDSTRVVIDLHSTVDKSTFNSESKKKLSQTTKIESNNSSRKRDKNKMTVKFKFKSPKTKMCSVGVEDTHNETQDNELINKKSEMVECSDHSCTNNDIIDLDFYNFETPNEYLKQNEIKTENTDTAFDETSKINLLKKSSVDQLTGNPIDNQQDNSFKSVFLDCLKTSCNMKVSLPNKIDNITKNDDRYLMAPSNSSVPPLSEHIDIRTFAPCNEKGNSLPSFSEVFNYGIESNMKKQSDKITMKRKGKRKRRLSLLITGDNVDQLLSKINYN